MPDPEKGETVLAIVRGSFLYLRLFDWNDCSCEWEDEDDGKWVLPEVELWAYESDVCQIADILRDAKREGCD